MAALVKIGLSQERLANRLYLHFRKKLVNFSFDSETLSLEV